MTIVTAPSPVAERVVLDPVEDTDGRAPGGL